MKRRYLRAIPVLTMLVLSQALSFAPVSTDNVDVLEIFTIESLVAKASDVVCPSVQAKADWDDNEPTDTDELQALLGDSFKIGDYSGEVIPGSEAGQLAKDEYEKNGGNNPTTKPSTNPTTNTRKYITNNTDHLLLVINDKLVDSDVAPYVISGRTMVPARVVSESLGADVKWENSTKTFTITNKAAQTIIEGKANSSLVFVNGIKVAIDNQSPNVTVEQKEGRVCVPIRFFAEKLGCNVEYKDRVVYIDIQ